jgi:hypothetical protein
MIELYPFLLSAFFGLFILYWLRSGLASSKTIDLGFVFVFVVFVYGLVPSVGFALAYSGIGEITESRMVLGIDESAVAYIELMHSGGSASFLFYAPMRRVRFVQKYSQ